MCTCLSLGCLVSRLSVGDKKNVDMIISCRQQMHLGGAGVDM